MSEGVAASGAEPGPDGGLRCPWGLSTPDYLAYHDEEWGRPVHGEAALYERLTLEAFQSGLSWITILRKREAFREVFAGFDPAIVASYDDTRVAALLTDARIVRNRSKVEAAVTNARQVLGARRRARRAAVVLRAGRVPSRSPHPGRRTGRDAESTAMAKELKRRGFRFVGPTTAYALMQATGMVNDHLADCTAR